MQREISLEKNQHKPQRKLSSPDKPQYCGFQLKKDVVLHVLNQTLHETGSETYKMVNRSLFEKYQCDLSDSFENPEYLSDVLKYVYDGSYHLITELIAKNLERFSDENGIKQFLEAISSK